MRLDSVLMLQNDKVCQLLTIYIYISVGNHFFQTLAKMASGLKLLLAKMKKNSPCLASDIFFKLANKLMTFKINVNKIIWF
jgi:hypothetical protein